jgi:hypothetical protein
MAVTFPISVPIYYYLEKKQSDEWGRIADNYPYYPDPRYVLDEHFSDLQNSYSLYTESTPLRQLRPQLPYESDGF